MTSLQQRFGQHSPRTAIILGSSLGGLADIVQDPVHIPYGELPGFPVPSVSGHAGRIVAGRIGATDVAVLQGRAHPYEGGNAAVMAPALRMLAEAGIETLILTNAAGSLDPAMRPGALMLIEDHLNLSGLNPLIGMKGENFVSLTDAYDPGLREGLVAAASRAQVELHKGVYVWCSGPSFETPAEIRAFRILGGSAVGMSTAPETILARRFGMKVAAISVITNLAAGIEGASPSHDETKTEGTRALGALVTLVTRFFEAA